MMNNVRLELVGYGYLNVIDSVPLSLMFNINDVRNISSRNGAWSKTCRIAGDAHNNSILGPIFDVNYDSPLLTFNAKRKERVRIIIDGFDMFEGIFQVVKIKKNLGNNKISVVYECHIKGDTSDFYRDIDGKLLTDLDLSQFDHTITESTIDVSMANGTYLDGYQYYLRYSPDSSYKIRDLIPSLYAKVMWQKIFDDSGYIYEWDEEFDLNFDKLIVPSNNGIYKPYDDTKFSFRSGFSIQHVLNTRTISYNLAGANESAFGPTIRIDNDNSLLENWFDNDNRYNSTIGSYDVSGIGGVVNFSLKFFGSVILNLTGVASTNIKGAGFSTSFNSETTIRSIYRVIVDHILLDSSGNFVANLASTIISDVEIEETYISSANILDQVQFEGSFVYDTDLFVGVTIINRVRSFLVTRQDPVDENGSVLRFNGFKDFSTGNTYTGQLRLVIDPQTSEFGLYSNSVEGYAVLNSPIFVNKLIPKEIKQSEFVDAFTKMFNLYIKEDKLNNKKLIIKTRDKFYSDGGELNWTNKLNADSVDIELISNLQKKRKIFSYKNDDKDLALSSYNKETSKVFGQLEYVFENEFIRDIDRVEPLFSPSVILDRGIGVSLDLKVPYIDSRNPTGKVRILYSGYYLDGNWNFYQLSDSLKTSYRYAGHLYPDPINPEEDLNFGLNDFYAHTYNQLTNNNLFNRFYSKQMNVFENGYIMTAYFDLDYSDIATLELNERIFVYDSWWNINKIIDFDVVSRDMTKVELISSDILSETFIPKRVNISSKVGKITGDIQRWNDSTGNVFGNGISGISISGNNNLIQPGSNNVSIVGTNNKSQSNNSSILGENNILNGGNSMVVGSDNILSGDKSVILGGSGNKLEGENSVLIGGSGAHLKGNNIVKIGGRLITGTNFVSAGRDVVLNRFPTGKHQNLISGSRDDVRQFGSHTIDNLVGGTRDEVI